MTAPDNPLSNDDASLATDIIQPLAPSSQIELDADITNYDQAAKMAMQIAESARQDWNSARAKEVVDNVSANTAEQKSAHAKELADAIVSHLMGVPQDVRMMTIMLILSAIPLKPIQQPRIIDASAKVTSIRPLRSNRT